MGGGPTGWGGNRLRLCSLVWFGSNFSQMRVFVVWFRALYVDVDVRWGCTQARIARDLCCLTYQLRLYHGKHAYPKTKIRPLLISFYRLYDPTLPWGLMFQEL
jgi:hypothetical protein